MKIRILLIAMCFVFPLITEPVQADDVPAPYILQDCLITPNIECIKSIDLTDSFGVVHHAVLTGKTWHGDEPFGPNTTYYNSTYHEYEVPGLTFEAPSGDRIIPRVFYFPLGNNPCAYEYSVCTPNEDLVQAVIEPSWFEGGGPTMALAHRPTNLVCGSQSNPQTCATNLLFNQTLKFTVVLELPPNFAPAYLTGRSKDLTYSSTLIQNPTDSSQHIEETLNFTNILAERELYSPLLTDPLDTSPYADYEADVPMVNIFSTRDSSGASLGKCTGIPDISVISNGDNPSVPTLEASTGAVNVRVQAAHYTVDGQPNSGFFQAAVSSQMANCLWGITLSNETQAQISVTDSSGDSQSDIQTITSQYDGNTFRISDSNFHFSSPDIAFKLFNASASKTTAAASVDATPAPLPSPAESTIPTGKPASSKVAKKSLPLYEITCQKGSIKTKISTKKCPAGYKLSK